MIKEGATDAAAAARIIVVQTLGSGVEAPRPHSVRATEFNQTSV
jgi:hypothetical protein